MPVPATTRAIATPQSEETLAPDEWMRLPGKELLRRLAIGNTANKTGHLDYVACRTPHRSKFSPQTVAFCDNFLVRVIVPDYHLKKPEVDDSGIAVNEEVDGRSKQYCHLGDRMTVLRDIMRDYQVEGDTERFSFTQSDKRRVIVKPVPMTPLSDADRVLLGRLGYNRCVFNHQPHKHVESGDQATKFYWQNIKISCQDSSLQFVIDFIRSGVLNNEKMYLKDFDTTIDCGGVFKRAEVLKYLNTLGFNLQNASGNSRVAGSCVLENTVDVGENCITWMTEIDGFRARLKLYLKLVQELEMAAVRADVGAHVWDWMCSHDNRLADARDATTETGMTRAEITVYFDRKPGGLDEDGNATLDSMDFHTAYRQLKSEAQWMADIATRAVQIVPEELVYDCPHRQMVTNWLNNMKHMLVLYDCMDDLGLVVYGFNEVTDKVAGYAVTSNWNRLSSYVMQMLMVKDLPIDVITIQRGTVPGRTVRVRGKDRFKPDPPAAQVIPEWLVKKMKLKPKARADGSLIPFTFKRPVDAEVDQTVPGSLPSMGFSVPAPPPPLPVAADNAAEGDGEEEAGGDDGSDDASDTDSVRDGAGVIESSDDEELSEEEEEEENGEEEDGDGRSVITRVIPTRNVEAGTCVISTTRFHRFAATPYEPLVARFPSSKSLATSMQKFPTNASDAAAQNATWQANKAFASSLLVSSGFAGAPIEPGGAPTAVAGVQAEIPYAKFVSTKKIDRFDLVQTESVLPINTLGIRPAASFEAYRVWKSVLKGRSNPFQPWFGKVLKRRNEGRAIDRLASIAVGAAERPMMYDAHFKEHAVVSFKSTLQTATTACKSLATLDTGEYPIVAVMQRGRSGNGGRTGISPLSNHVVFLREPDSTTASAFTAPGIINEGMKTHRDALAPHLLNGRGGAFWFSLTDVSMMGSIGTLTRLADVGTNKRRRITGSDGVTRSQIDIGLVLEIHGITVADSEAAKRAAAQALEKKGAASVDSSDAATVALPIPDLTTGELQQTKGFMELFPGVNHPVGLKLQVLAVGTFTHGRRKDIPVLKTYVCGADPSTAVCVWANTARLTEIAGKLHTGAPVLIVTKYMAGDVIGGVGCDANDWLVPSRAGFAAATTPFGKGMPAGKQILHIESVKYGQTKNGGKPQPVIRCVDGHLWRFSQWNHGRKFETADQLRTGFGINLPAWTSVPPVTAGAGGSNDPLP